MFHSISEQIANKLIENKTIQAEDKEIYQFGVQQGLTILLNIVTVIIIGMVLQMLGQAVLFMMAYIPLRSYAGGFHAKTPIRCYVYSSVLIAAVLLAMRFMHIPFLIYCLLYIISSIVVLIFSPVEDNNKPLDEIEKSVYKKRTSLIWMAESIIVFVCILLKSKIIIECFVLSLFSLAVILILGILKNNLT